MPLKSDPKLLCAVLLSLAVAAPAYAQDKPVPRYGEVDKDKSPGEIEAERRADEAYKRALGNVPSGKQSSDPWGSVRSETAPKAPPKAKTTTSPPKGN